jgi:hypothetical protein
VTVSLAVVCEARADLATAAGLVDRVLRTEIDWIDESVLDDYRSYRGLEANEELLRWQDVHHRARERNIRALGHFGGQPGAAYSHVARLALLLLLSSGQRPDGVVLVIDDDGQRERREGLEQARNAVPGLGPVVIGVAHPRRECWVLAGFEPEENQQGRLDELRGELGFDPRSEAHRLNDRHDHQPRSAKRVLAALVGDAWERQAACWITSPLGLLESRGQSTGLADFLREVRERLLPLFRDPRRP